MGLFRGKKTTPIEPRRAVRPQDGGRPDFVYYTNRKLNRETTGKGEATDRTRSLLHAPIVAAQRTKDRRTKLLRRLLIIPGLLLVGQLVALGSTSKVVLLQPDGTQSSEGTESYQRIVDEILATSLWNRSKITIDTQHIEDEIRRRQPEVESTVLTVPIIGSQPKVYIAKSEPVFTLHQGTSFYTLSASGYITDVITGDVTLPLVQDDTGEKVEVGKRLLPSSHVGFMQKVLFQFEQANINVSAFVLPAKKAYEVDVRLDDKPYSVRFNFEEDALQQTGAAIATIEQLGTAVPSSYLDVRVPGRAYYK